ncbi:YgiQ family radical SAM protein [bacterium]|nr:YgiQ family radical SAM protein [bacterium]
MFLPTTRDEMIRLGWSELDMVLVTGDAYIDSPLIGIAVIGHVLVDAGYRVGIIAQPDLEGDDISRLGEPNLFWGVSAGSVDSMVANTTALKKRRRTDDYTPGGVNDRRPDRATIAYSNLIRRHFKGTKPIVLGGLEASLRRIAHYDFWSDSVRRSILFDAKADLLVYGMGEGTVLELADHLKHDRPLDDVRGICRIVKELPKGVQELPAYEDVKDDKGRFTDMFRAFYEQTNPIVGKPLAQKHGDRYLLQHSPALPIQGKELDRVYSLDYEREAHPSDASSGEIRALDTIRFSLATHRGCYGECNFCAIAVHQGRMIQSRSEKSILAEARTLTKHPKFKGILYDGGSPTGNMYGSSCAKWDKRGPCSDKSCISPGVCKALRASHKGQIDLLKQLRKLPGVKHLFVTSGLRHDLILADEHYGEPFLRELVEHHVSGQLKIAPEHTEPGVLKAMRKPKQKLLKEFRKRFNEASKRAEKKTGRKSFLTYYLIAAHPGCGETEMKALRDYTRKELQLTPEQVQIFTPLPSTWSALMYWTGIDPFTGDKVFVERDMNRKRKQKELVTGRK